MKTVVKNALLDHKLVLVLAPPRSGKSTLAVELARECKGSVAYYSYSKELAADKAKQAGEHVTPFQVGDGAPGRSWDLVIFDEPYKSAVFVQDGVYDCIQMQQCRIPPGGRMVVLGSRFAAADAFGKLATDPHWKTLSFPAVSRGGYTSFGFDLRKMWETRHQLGEDLFNLMYQQLG
jgi:hypothetical protein